MQSLVFFLVERIWIKGSGAFRLFKLHVLGEIRMLLILVQICLANNRPALHRPMILRAGNRVGLTGLLKSSSYRKILTVTAAERVSVETDAAAHTSGSFSSIAQGEAEGVISKSRLDPDRAANTSVAKFDL